MNNYTSSDFTVEELLEKLHYAVYYLSVQLGEHQDFIEELLGLAPFEFDFLLHYMPLPQKYEAEEE